MNSVDSARIDAYLRRLGAARPVRPTAEALCELHLRHLLAVPFENLSMHLGEEIVLEEDRLLDKVVGAGRGGFCYELNGAFAVLLSGLGFGVTPLAGRVYGEEGRLGIPYDHLALRVRTVDAGEWLADVGFGAHSHYPLAFAERGEQADPGGMFRITAAGPDAAGVSGAAGTADGGAGVSRDGTTGDPVPGATTGDPHVLRDGASADPGVRYGTSADPGVRYGTSADPGVRDGTSADPGAWDGTTGDLDVLRDGRPEYRLEVRPRVLGDFTAGAWWHSTSPASHFTQSLVCSRVTEDGGRVTLSGRKLTVTAGDGTREVRELGRDEEVLGVYREQFGIALDRVPTVRNPLGEDRNG
ncbi:arylamine N-acetyltransferase [Streptomyces sp. NPDC006655]|uniref:arylamine N-acetyltransferase family protein n=1 Tax=Streptomyces sp. NPDC006655 TaxID=3156898 RepID=UPI003452F3AC